MIADWVSVEAAVSAIIDSVKMVDTEVCDLTAASRRVLAEDVVAPIDLPRWTNSAMDGFAVHSADILTADSDRPVLLPVVDDIAAGAFPNAPLRRGAAARVTTGAPVPEDADTVVRVEHTDGGRDIGAPGAQVRILSSQDAGRNLRRRGEELARGDVALPRGTPLTPGAIGIAASLGKRTLVVRRQPIVALLTSGDELVHVEDYHEVIAGNKIVSSNSYTLAALIAESGCGVRYLGIASDSRDSLRTALRGAIGCDAVVTSAGVSVGEHDHIRHVLLEMNTAVKFWRVRMRPGSPFAFGSIGDLGGIPWFGLPGNPVSSAVTFELLARPALLRMGGRQSVFRRWLPARFIDDHAAQPGLTQFVRVRLEQASDGSFIARLAGLQGSGMLSSVANADGLLVIPEDFPEETAGKVFRVIAFESGLYAPTSAV
jgi:molybdopterin molybdotransferase